MLLAEYCGVVYMFCGHSCMGSMQTMHIAAIVWEGEEGGEGRGGGRRGKGRREEREGEEGGEGRGGGRREGEKGHQLLFHVVDSIRPNQLCSVLGVLCTCVCVYVCVCMSVCDHVCVCMCVCMCVL